MRRAWPTRKQSLCSPFPLDRYNVIFREGMDDNIVRVALMRPYFETAVFLAVARCWYEAIMSVPISSEMADDFLGIAHYENPLMQQRACTANRMPL